MQAAFGVADRHGGSGTLCGQRSTAGAASAVRRKPSCWLSRSFLSSDGVTALGGGQWRDDHPRVHRSSTACSLGTSCVLVCSAVETHDANDADELAMLQHGGWVA